MRKLLWFANQRGMTLRKTKWFQRLRFNVPSALLTMFFGCASPRETVSCEIDPSICASDQSCVNNQCVVIDIDAQPLPDADRADTSITDSSFADNRAAQDAVDNAFPCGDGTCDPDTEDAASCATDCWCGDTVCHPENETRASCPDDCGPMFDGIEWIVQDRVRADPRLDPVCVSNAERDEQDAYASVHFRKVDFNGRQNFTSFVVRAFHDQTRWTDRAMVTFDFPPYFESQRRLGGKPFDAFGGDTMESEGPLVSIVGTNDSNGANGWFNNTGAFGCSYGDAWVLYAKNDMPISAGDRVVNWSDELQTPIRGVSPPALDNCPVANDTSRTRWTFYPQFAYSAESVCDGETGPKRIDTIVADHGAGNLNHHEVFYLTDEYGFTRWERWNCKPTPTLKRPDPDYAALRCNYEESESVMHMAYAVPERPNEGWQIRNRKGRYCVLVDCRDNTHLVPHDSPAGWIPAGWPTATHVYYSGNLLASGDFAWNDAGPIDAPWSVQGTMVATIVIAKDGNHHAEMQVSSAQGWLSQTAPLDKVYAAFGAGASSAGPLRIRFGIRARALSSTPRAMQLVVVQWTAGLAEGLGTHIENVTVTDKDKHFLGSVALHPKAAHAQIRLSLSGAPGPTIEVDDAFLVVTDGT